MGLVITPLDTPKRFNPLAQPLGAPQKLGGRELVWRFDGGDITSDGGALLLKAADRRYGLTEALAGCVADKRQAGKVDHSLQELLAQRVFAIACGYPDAND